MKILPHGKYVITLDITFLLRKTLSLLQADEDSNCNDEVCEETTGPSHTEATSMLQKYMLNCKTDDTSAGELWTSKHLQDCTVRKQVSKLMQKNFKNYLK